MNLSDGERRCRGCGRSEVEELQKYRDLARVSSDCRSLNTRGCLYWCPRCGLVQKVLTRSLKKELRGIYQSYETYQNNIEPMVFSSDVTEHRSNLIFNTIEGIEIIPSRGTYVDIGCGDGSFLKVFSNHRPEWSLHGFDVNERRTVDIEKVCGKGHFISKSLDKIPDAIDLITMNYVLEHIDDVDQLLETLFSKLSQNGKLVAIVPDLENNPYDIVVGDHLSHYTEETLRNQFQNFNLIKIKKIFQKELIVLARKKDSQMGTTSTVDALHRDKNLGEESIRYLLNVRSQAQVSSIEEKVFGILGTAIAGTWLSTELQNTDHFFVDENTEKCGRFHLGKAILGPNEVPDGATIYLPFDLKTSTSIMARMKNLSNVKFVQLELN